MNKKEITEEENTKYLKKFLFYGGIFLFGIIVVLTNKFYGNNVKNQNIKEEEKNKISKNKLLETLDNINNDYYSMNVYLTLDDDAITLNYQKLSDSLEIGRKKYHKNEQEYIKYENEYYLKKETNFEKEQDFLNFDYDKTFIDLKNIKELLKEEGEYISYILNDYTIYKYTYNLNSGIKIYNNYNKASIMPLDNGNIEVTSYEKNEKLDYIEINIKDLYNLINNTNYEIVKYKISVKAEKEEDTSWLLEKLK